MKLREIGESKLIERIQRRFPARRRNTLVSIGDDAAVVRVGEEKVFLLTTDMLIEGTHFIRGTISYPDLGYKSLAVNLSDIAAMGGTPLHALISLALPPDMSLEDVEAFYDGVQELAGEFGVEVVGGDITSSSVGMIINVTVTGEVESYQPALQNGAREGDLVAVTGELGASVAGLSILLNEQLSFPPLMKEQALAKHYRPFPRVREGRQLVGTGKIHAMKDISDGLAKEVNLITRSSGKMAVLYAEKIPVSPCATEIGNILGQSPIEMALQGGEDYELVFTFPAAARDLLANIALQHGFSIHVVGEILPGEGVFLEWHGKRKVLPPGGYEHF